MLDEIINNPELERFIISCQAGQIIFLEGDDAQDLYILVSGGLDVLKGNMKIAEITERGSLFGEMSFLLESKRTATTKAKDDVRAIRIPKDEIKVFLQKFPNVAEQITKVLARRLYETSRILYGLKEFCDQLPDAVILTDRTGNILTWNSAAEKLYGRNWDQMQHHSVEEIYEEPQVYRNFLEEVQERYSVREKILRVRHPRQGTRFVSTSTTLLYDGQHNCQGVLSLGRDVTAVKRMERRYRQARIWLIPVFILLFLLAGAFFLGYSGLLRVPLSPDEMKQGLNNQLARDRLLLSSLLAGPFMAGDRSGTSRILKEFMEVQPEAPPYVGIVLLDPDKRVFDAYSIKGGQDTSGMIGNSYGGIQFQGGEESPHRVLVLYRASRESPMGHKGIELAFRMRSGGRFLGWLLFQMDADQLKKEYRIDETGLRAFRFPKQKR